MILFFINKIGYFSPQQSYRLLVQQYNLVRVACLRFLHKHGMLMRMPCRSDRETIEHFCDIIQVHSCLSSFNEV